MNPSLSQLKPGSHIHLIGICGTAMASLAGILKSLGFVVSGSDQNVYPPMSTQLESLGISIQLGYRAENLNPRPDLVIVGNVVSKTNPEAEAMVKADIPFTSLPKAMGEFVIADRDSLVVAGTHGKTTTTALLSWTAEQVGLSPGFLIGGIPLNFSQSFRKPEKNTFVIEGDEYDTAYFDKVPKFIHYRPKYVILTSIEFDHADIYRDLAHVKEAFSMLLERIPADGTLVYNAEDQNILSLLDRCKAKVKIGYGHNKGDVRIKERSIINDRNILHVLDTKSQQTTELSLQIFGVHNSLNALAVWALSQALGWSKDGCQKGLSSFLGVKRRQEFLGEIKGVTLIEDFAHHPTAVRLTLDCMRERFPNRRLVAVFEPRSATSRRRVFQDEYLQAFLRADVVVMAQPFDQTKIAEQDRFSTDELIAKLKGEGRKGLTSSTSAGLVQALIQEIQQGDVVLIMSNGGFDGIYKKLEKGIELAL